MSKKSHTPHEHDIGCLEAIEGLYAWLDKELENPDSISSIEEHIRHCESCYSRAEVEKLLTERIRRAEGPQAAGKAPAALKSRMKKLIDQF
mgnify:CR=1 FL=1|jgi:anti-sigma factor (TIGR02949 family)